MINENFLLRGWLNLCRRFCSSGLRFRSWFCGLRGSLHFGRCLCLTTCKTASQVRCLETHLLCGGVVFWFWTRNVVKVKVFAFRRAHGRWRLREFRIKPGLSLDWGGWLWTMKAARQEQPWFQRGHPRDRWSYAFARNLIFEIRTCDASPNLLMSCVWIIYYQLPHKKNTHVLTLDPLVDNLGKLTQAQTYIILIAKTQGPLLSTVDSESMECMDFVGAYHGTSVLTIFTSVPSPNLRVVPLFCALSEPYFEESGHRPRLAIDSYPQSTPPKTPL